MNVRRFAGSVKYIVLALLLITALALSCAGSANVTVTTATTHTVKEPFLATATVTKTVTIPAPAATAALTTAADNKTAGIAGAPVSAKRYVGSSGSDKYHYPSCRYAQNIKAANEVWFSSAVDALAHGYSPCGVCKPPTTD